MHKIILVGCPGSGKSTLANKLGRKLGVPVYHLDKIMWKENYQPIRYRDFIAAQEDIFKTNEWIIDGNFTNSIPRRVEESDIIIFFEIPRIICLWRIIKRYFRYFGKTRPDMGGDNKDKLGFKIIKFVLTYPVEKIRGMLSDITKGKKLYIVKNNIDIEYILRDIS